jgi:hypothetical protein
VKLWHVIGAAAALFVIWYVYDKVDAIAFAYVDGKLFPKPPTGFTTSHR